VREGVAEQVADDLADAQRIGFDPDLLGIDLDGSRGGE
jgi:hypothetical protein